MAKGKENVRLLLVTNEGAKSGPRGCFWFTMAQVCFVFIFLAFLVFIALRVAQIQKEIKTKETKEGETIPGTDLCKSVNAENMSSVALGYLKGIREEKNMMDARNKIYYITDRLFTDQEACTIEAVLRLLQDKLVFVIEIENGMSTNHTQINYVEFLREHYTNLNQIKTTWSKFFKGSPFQNFLKNGGNDFSTFAAQVLLVWQFGGTVLSSNFLLLNRRLYDANEGFCEVDRELLFCPNQCAAYVYQLIKTVLDILKVKKPQVKMEQDVLQRVIDISVGDYCGDQDSIHLGCMGVNRIKQYKVCNAPRKDCDYLRVQQWKLRDEDWKTTIQKFCPKIVTKYLPYLLHSTAKPFPEPLPSDE